ncbi:MAG: Flp pilus assembly complex ATPase component TadA, partial [Lentisphaeria bacterium]|nr:Flp pilus assembly complex ATPase component TadA [Lentisphaeria bacterium]
VVEQRELHSDTLSFASALKYALRQDPDVIMVGEMRDVETIAAVLTAAETGHLVFATIHTNSAPQTIDRIVDSFPSHQQNQIRQQLASVILGVVSQRLLPRLDGTGRAAAFEILIGTPPVQSLIREGKTFQLQSVLETSGKDGMITLEKSMENLYNAGIVSLDEIQSYHADYKVSQSF